jgi:hypothetical protein
MRAIMGKLFYIGIENTYVGLLFNKAEPCGNGGLCNAYDVIGAKARQNRQANARCEL